MTDVRRSFTVAQSREKVVAYLQDFANAEAWDPGTVSCSRIGAGPLRVGARWHNQSKFRGRTTELQYELTRLEPDHLTFVGENKTVTATDDLTFTDVEGGTEIDYHAHFEWHGWVKLAAPFVNGAIQDLGDPTVEQLTKVLEALP